VTVQAGSGELRVFHGGVEVARHAERRGRRERAIEASHLIGIVANDHGTVPISTRPEPAELLRPLAEYERAVGGSW
jgi:hypothetical protein